MAPAMLINALLALAMFVLLGFAFGRRPGHLTTSLAVALAISLALVATLPKPDQLSALLAVDAGLVAFAARLAQNAKLDIAEPAKIIAIIGAIKITFAVVGALVELNHNMRAAGRNGAFIIQILVAGGLLDGLIAWLGHRCRVIGLGARRVSHHRVEGE